MGAHLISPGSHGLFSKAVMESNPLATMFNDRDSASVTAVAIARFLGCPQPSNVISPLTWEQKALECLIEKDFSAILEAQTKVSNPLAQAPFFLTGLHLLLAHRRRDYWLSFMHSS